MSLPPPSTKRFAAASTAVRSAQPSPPLSTAIVCEPGFPFCFARGEYALANLRRDCHWLRHLRRAPFRIWRRIRSHLYPVTVALSVDVHDAQIGRRDRCVAVFSLKLAKKCGDRQFRTIEMHVEVVHFVRGARLKI